MVLLVKDVMVTQVVTISPDQSVKNAARTMTKFNISSLLVMEKGGRILGIVTERDIVSRVVCSGLDPNVVSICDIMSEPIIAVGPEEPIETAVELMLTHKIKKLPVMEKREDAYRLLGILSLLDVARIQPELINSLKILLNTEGVPMESEPSFYVS
jgi:CBS domain-containing protein